MRVRGWARRALIAVVSLAGLALTARGAMFVPAVYFHVAFSTIQRSSLMRDRVDWRALRAEADELRRGARSTADTYPAIRLVLQRLGDHHSHLSTPATMHAHRGGATWAPGLTVIGPERVVALVSPGGPADKAGIAVGDIVETVNGQAPSHALFLSVDGPAIDLTVRRPGDATARGVRLQPGLTVFNQPATVRRLKGRLGYIDVPGVVGGGGRFAEDAVGPSGRSMRNRHAPGWWTCAAMWAGTCGRCCSPSGPFSGRPLPAISCRAVNVKPSRTVPVWQRRYIGSGGPTLLSRS